ncbi:hypothetical protein [Streptomyces sp. CS014]|uniref:hypothetical protein n=1 Tax=Streptomyces sp. CS014 TaxID=2162707 RepID=UPI000D516025|nr:hypothetical protein [Streptomyces sp. CS014]PVC81562.1 hypothetical protein DBP12_36730 [Streptomyces sp. CS014]
MPRLPLVTERLTLFATLLATFGELHPACDHWVQGSKTASRKRMYGEDLVHADGTPATPDTTRPTMTTSTLGRRAVACHVASYSAVQLVPHQATFALATSARRRRSSAWRFRQMM